MANFILMCNFYFLTSCISEIYCRILMVVWCIFKVNLIKINFLERLIRLRLVKSIYLSALTKTVLNNFRPWCVCCVVW